MGKEQIYIEVIVSGATVFTAALNTEESATKPCFRYGSVSGSLAQDSVSGQIFQVVISSPTSEDFGFHARWTDHQACIWRTALDSEPPEVDATDYGWVYQP